MNSIRFVILLLFASHPILLALSFKGDSLARSDQQWFSLPLRRSTVVLSRALSTLLFFSISISAAFLLSLIMVPVEIHQMEDVVKSTGLGVDTSPQFIPFYHDYRGFFLHQSRTFFEIKIFAACSFVLIGMVVLNQALKYTLRWYNGFLRSLTLIAALILFCRYGIGGADFSKGEHALITVLIGLATGAVLACIGFVLFDNTAEV